jgi:nicotinate-nucleotide pyrophosphorylase (carboxylating)
MGNGDVTTDTLFPDEWDGSADIVSRREGVLAGLPVATRIFEMLGGVECTSLVEERERIKPDQPVLRLNGSVKAILRGERTALNFLGHLSGIATLTRRYVDAIEGTRARIVDTRKTLPGLRALQKYAVRAGGGINHRFTLSSMVMIKDNHIAAYGSIGQAVEKIRRHVGPSIRIEVETDSLGSVQEALAAEADVILLDNMSLTEVKQAVKFAVGKAELEVSGNVTLETVRDYAETGVDWISVGALTHSVPQHDFSMEVKG